MTVNTLVMYTDMTMGGYMIYSVNRGKVVRARSHRPSSLVKHLGS